MELSMVGVTISWTNFMIWVIFGIGAGAIAHYLSFNAVRGGVSASMILGILGAVSGGSFATFIYGIGMRGIDLTSLAIAISASLVFLTLYQLTENKPGKKLLT